MNGETVEGILYGREDSGGKRDVLQKKGYDG